MLGQNDQIVSMCNDCFETHFSADEAEADIAEAGMKRIARFKTDLSCPRRIYLAPGTNAGKGCYEPIFASASPFGAAVLTQF